MTRPDNRKRISPEDKVPLKLTDKERKLILEETFIDMSGPTTLRSLRSMTGEVSFNLDDWEELQEYVAATANHAKSKKLQKDLDVVWKKIQEIFDTYRDQDD